MYISSLLPESAFHILFLVRESRLCYNISHQRLVPIIMISDFVTNGYGESFDSSCEKS